MKLPMTGPSAIDEPILASICLRYSRRKRSSYITCLTSSRSTEAIGTFFKMFAVPGWSLGELKTQAEEPQKKKSTSGSSKKRKRKLAQEKHSSGANSIVVNGLSNKRRKPDQDEASAVPEPQVAKAEAGYGLKRSRSRTEDDQSSGNKKSKRRKEEEPPTLSGESSKKGASIKSTVDSMPSAPPPSSKLTPLQSAMRQKLAGARFRHLNETLYTTPSDKSLALFEANPTFFDEYHEGFRQQVSSWPENPVDSYLEDLKRRGNARWAGKEESNTMSTPLPRSNGSCYVGDLGCGDAALAKKLAPETKKLNVKISSYDLHGNNALVTKADISDLPVKEGSVNVAIFCLALMGTNWVDFVEEAWRVLRWKGELWVAEIKSRFATPRRGKVVEHSVGKKRKKPKDDSKENAQDEGTLGMAVDGGENGENRTDVSAFVDVLRRRGFALQSEGGVDLRNKMFVKMRFVKALTPLAGKCEGQGQGPGKISQTGRKGEAQTDGDIDETGVLKPCLYKTR